jgi:hypothetical protein
VSRQVLVFAALVAVTLPPPYLPPVNALIPGGSVESVMVWQSGGLSAETIEAIAETAWKASARTVLFHQGTLRMLAVSRHEQPVQIAQEGYGYPMSVGAVDPERAAPALGPWLVPALSAGQVVMSARSASLRGAMAGDTIALEGWNGRVLELRIGAVIDDATLGWVELLVSEETASDLGLVRPSKALIWGGTHPEEVAALLRLRLPQQPVRLVLPGDGGSADEVLATIEVKERFGEFSFRWGIGDAIVIDRDWVERSIVWADFPLVGRMRCHRQVVPYIRAALRSIEAAGWGDAVDYADTQAAGGCYNPRLARGGDLNRGFALSRHAWGIALDINPSTNQFGEVTTIPQGIGETFQRFGFSWGAEWLVSDPMHFEWSRIPVDAPIVCAILGLQAPALPFDSWTVYARNSTCLEE